MISNEIINSKIYKKYSNKNICDIYISKMPGPSQKIRMNLNVGAQMNSLNQAMMANLVKTQNAQQRRAPTALTSPMISRIHNVRPGCGSCGK